MMLLTKEKCEENVLEAIADCSACKCPWREMAWDIASVFLAFSILNCSLCKEWQCWDYGESVIEGRWKMLGETRKE